MSQVLVTCELSTIICQCVSKHEFEKSQILKAYGKEESQKNLLKKKHNRRATKRDVKLLTIFCHS